MQLSYRSRRRPSRASVFFFLLALLFVGVNYFLADEAHAAHPTDMTVEFQNLELIERKGGLIINYEVQRRSWRGMRQADMDPRLNLYTRDRRRQGFEFAFSVELDSRIGRIELPKQVKLRGTRVVEMEVVGFSGFYRVTQTRFGDACDAKVRLRVQRGNGNGHGGHAGGGHGHDHDDHDDHHERPGYTTAQLINACKASAHSTNVSSCITKANALPRGVDVPATIRACGNATQWNSEFNTCMDRAKSVRNDPAGVVAACDEATQWNSELSTCISKAARHTGPRVAAVIKACGEATQWNSEFNACLDGSRSLGARPARTIKACADATTWNSEFNSCLQSASTTRERRREPA